MAASLVHTFRTMRSHALSVQRLPRSERHNRPPTDTETLVLKTLADTLRPTVLEPFRDFERPWRESATVPVNAVKVAVVQDFAARMNAKLETFIASLPTLLSAHNSPDELPDLAQIMDWRVEGRSYDAMRALSTLIEGSQGDSDLLRLHHADTLWDLGLHDQLISRRLPREHRLPSRDLVKAALTLIGASAGLVGGSFSNASFEAATSPGVTDIVLDGESRTRSATEYFAGIVYCHTIITRYRFACLIDHGSQSTLAGLSSKALVQLLTLWKEIKDDSLLNQGYFLRWRCATALHDCIPFSSVSVGLPVRRDALSLWATPDFPSDLDDTLTQEAVSVRRALQTGGAVSRSMLDPLEAHLDTLIELRDLRGIDELLLALQMPVHPGYQDMQRSLRRITWKLHEYMVPSAPWILDGALFHPLSLWIGEEYRCGRAKETRWFPPCPESGRDTSQAPLSRLQIGFGHLEPEPAAGARFVYGWSILNCCLQYTPSPMEDEAYRTLYVDHDIFSFSQLFNRVRQVCRYTLSDEQDFTELTLDGFDDRHRHVAGLGLADIFGDPSARLGLLSREIDGLNTLVGQLQSLWTKSRSEGLQHLIGMCVVYRGCAHAEKATEVLARLNGTRGESLGTVHDVRTELSRARDMYKEAFENYQELVLGEITRRGGEGLIRVQSLLASCADPPSDGSNDAQQKREARAMFKLCQELQIPLRARMIQAYGTPTVRFAWKGNGYWSTLKTGPGDHPTCLYEAGQQALHSLGEEEAGFHWLHGDSEDLSMGQQLEMELKAAYPQLAEFREPVVLAGQCLSGRMIDYTTLLSNTQVDDPSRELWANLGPEIVRAVIVQYSVGPQDQIQLHLRRLNSTSQSSCGVTYQTVKDYKHYFKGLRWTDQARKLFRELDPLVTQLYASVKRDELLILVPGSVCRGVLLHTLHANRDTPLGYENTVFYTPDLQTLNRCLDLTRHRPSHRSKNWRMAAATVWEDGGATEAEVKGWEDHLCDTVDAVAGRLKGTTLKRTEVTKSKFRDMVSKNECVFFLGHGAGDEMDSLGNISAPGIIMTDGHSFEGVDFPADLPGSLFVLLACSTAADRERGGRILETLPNAALRNGAVAAVATTIVIWTDALVKMADLVSKELVKARKTAVLTRDNRFNLAEALRRSLATAHTKIQIDKRKVPKELVISAEQLWAPFVVVGSPLIDLSDYE